MFRLAFLGLEMDYIPYVAHFRLQINEPSQNQVQNRYARQNPKFPKSKYHQSSFSTIPKGL